MQKNQSFDDLSINLLRCCNDVFVELIPSRKILGEPGLMHGLLLHVVLEQAELNSLIRFEFVALLPHIQLNRRYVDAFRRN